MKHGEAGYRPDDLAARMTAVGVSLQLQEKVQQVVAFHTCPAPGALIGTFMVDWGLALLGKDRREKLYAVCETPKCLPDPIQVLAGCTTGNSRLKVIPIGKFALTMNGASNEPTTEAVRIFVDGKKLPQFRIIDLWYNNSPDFDKHTMTDPLLDEIFRAGRAILSQETVRVTVTQKKKWRPVTCPGCGETVPDYLVIDGHCTGCGSLKYYEEVR